MLDSFIEALARPNPVPGGGAAAAHGACVGLAPLETIIKVELQRTGDCSEAEWKNLLKKVKKASSALLQLRDEDGKAYERFAQAKTFGKGKTEVLEALQQAIECPIRIMAEAGAAINHLARAGMYCKGHLLSDLLVVCELLRGAISGAHRIAQANLSIMEASSERSEYTDRLEQLFSDSRGLYESVGSALMHKAGFKRANFPWEC
jgi:formiminotetrahydrofolate cyclodeaminase